MTNKELLQYTNICFCIRKYREELKQLEIRISGASAANLTGMPRSGKVTSSVESAVLKKEALEERIAKLNQAKKNIETFVSSIEDPLYRIWAEGRYIEGLSWIQVSLKYGRGITADTISKTVRRYITSRNSL